MKIILIPSCSKCPHGAMWDLDGKQYMCAELRKVNTSGDKTILDSCKLQDAFQVLRELAKQRTTSYVVFKNFRLRL